MNPHKQLASAVVENIKKLPSFRKIPVNRLWLFANDLSLVVLGIRTGYLLDAFAIPNPVDTFTCLINQLRMHRPDFSFIVHIYEPASDQSFFVNSHLFRRMHQCSSFSASLQQDQSCCPDYTSFVLLSESPALVRLLICCYHKAERTHHLYSYPIRLMTCKNRSTTCVMLSPPLVDLQYHCPMVSHSRSSSLWQHFCLNTP